MLEFDRDPVVAEQQMEAIIFLLVAFGYIDEAFDASEQAFIRKHIGSLVSHRAKSMTSAPGIDIAERWTKHFLDVFDEYDATVQSYFTESVSEGETTFQFVLSKLKLRCLELLKRFDENNRAPLLDAVEQLMRADGVVHPNEQEFRDEIVRLVNVAVELEEVNSSVGQGSVVIREPCKMMPRIDNHPFFRHSEWDYTMDSAAFARESKADIDLIAKAIDTLTRLREEGAGRLSDVQSFAAFDRGGPFLDGYVHVLPDEPDKEYELLVLGDLHGCYSCLKAALLQADFFTKVQNHRENPGSAPSPYLVLLGDYIDRGKFSFSGTLRNALQLFVHMPERVFVLRGNHEYYVEVNGRVMAPVRPCEAMDGIAEVADNDVFVHFKKLFEELPQYLAFAGTFFVHGGIPRSDTFKEKWGSLSSLNDSEVRFQMLWSDPSEADLVPLDLQQASARFSFGRRQFQQFMATIGCRTMVRGHERIVEGFRQVYSDEEARLFTLFSAGGSSNEDLPPASNYREVTPMALTVRHVAGTTTFQPFALDFARFNNPEYNGFFRSPSRQPPPPKS